MRPGFLLAASIAVCASLLNSCDDAAHPTAPVSMSQAIAGSEERLVTMMDACDPATFNAANVTCVRSGGVTFQRFLELLGKHQSVGAWRFSPGILNAKLGQTLLAVNRGGEVHTFTEVPRFGNGCVPLLNTGDGPPVVNCALLAQTAVAPGGTRTVSGLAPGRHLFECLIHPWMRSVAKVERDDDHGGNGDDDDHGHHGGQGDDDDDHGHHGGDGDGGHHGGDGDDDGDDD
jgi:hypothetical protein